MRHKSNEPVALYQRLDALDAACPWRPWSREAESPGEVNG